MLLQFRRKGRRRLQASFRRGTSYPFWRLGFRQSSFRHITRIFPARRPVRLGTAAGFLAVLLSPSPFGSWVSHQIQKISSHLCPLRGRYNTAPRGAAAGKCSNCTEPTATSSRLLKTSDLHQRPTMTVMQLVHTEVIVCSAQRATARGNQCGSRLLPWPYGDRDRTRTRASVGAQSGERRRWIGC